MSYVITTGAVSALIVLAHGVRAVAQGAPLVREPGSLATTLVAVGLSAWAARWLARSSR